MGVALRKGGERTDFVVFCGIYQIIYTLLEPVGKPHLVLAYFPFLVGDMSDDREVTKGLFLKRENHCGHRVNA